MKHQQLGNTFVLLLSTGERVIESITAFCREKSISAAQFTAIGAVSEVELGFYNLATKEYAWKKAEAELEIDSIIGNVALFEGEPLVHAHATVSDSEMHSFGGHLKEAVVGASCEVFLTPLQGKLERKYDDTTGLKLIHFD
ncbi:DNA-binding protein [Candidatus Woesearchaeota archaeon]|nr:DNA-binding protein [Candidatus Woesearchaeota archaeon]